jgi:hypothetical protein
MAIWLLIAFPTIIGLIIELTIINFRLRTLEQRQRREK